MTAPAPPRSDVQIAAERIVRLLNEVEAGRRPGRQVSRLFAAHLRGAIQRARPSPGPVADLHRLVITASAAHTFEVVAVCRRDERYGAIGLRLSHTGRGWIVTDVVHPTFLSATARDVSDPPSRARPSRRRRG